MLEAKCPKCGSKLVITSNDEGKEVMPIERIMSYCHPGGRPLRERRRASRSPFSPLKGEN